MSGDVNKCSACGAMLMPIALRLNCPACGELHIDEGELATKPHHTHSCQKCGLTWRPAVVHTVGVRFLPGFKNEEPSDVMTSAEVSSTIAKLGLDHDFTSSFGGSCRLCDHPRAAHRVPRGLVDGNG